MNYICNVAIIVAGPAGLYSGFWAGNNNLNAIIIDNESMTGGQCVATYAEKNLYNVPGYLEITGKDFALDLKKQCDQFNHNYLLKNKISSIEKIGDIFHIKTNQGVTIQSQSVLIAMGYGSLEPNKFNIPGINELEGKSVFYSIENINVFNNKKLMIIGTCNTAADWARMLANSKSPPSKIDLVYRNDEMKGTPYSFKRLATLDSKLFNLRVKFVIDYVLKTEDGSIDVALRSVSDQSIKTTHNIDYLFLFLGLKSNLDPVKNLNLKIDKNRIIIDPETMNVGIDGVYAAGDVCDFPGKERTLAATFCDASRAVNNLYGYLRKKFRIHTDCGSGCGKF
jgi:thioredoxin reductase